MEILSLGVRPSEVVVLVGGWRRDDGGLWRQLGRLGIGKMPVAASLGAAAAIYSGMGGVLF